MPPPNKILTPADDPGLFADILRRIDALERSPQLVASSIKEGQLTILDAAGVRRSQFGKQDDASYGIRVWDDAGNLILTQKWIAQYDSWPSWNNCDATHPLNLDFEVYPGIDHWTSARLSFRLGPYQTFSTLALTATGAGTAHGHTGGVTTGQSADHNHASAAHAHTSTAHTHHNSPSVGTGDALLISGTALKMAAGPNGGWDTDSTTPGDTGTTSPAVTGGTSAGHTHTSPTSGNESTHTHTVSGTTTLGVSEGATATGVVVTLDGGALLPGPYNTDQTQLDVFLAISPLATGWHRLTLQPSGLGNIKAVLRLGYAISPGVR